MASKYNQRSVVMSPERMRERMLQGLILPPEMLNRAIRKTADLLDAKETKFFTHRGEVVQTAEVEAHEVQLRAADQLYSLAGLYVKEKVAEPLRPAVAMEIDPVTGVIRVIVGAVHVEGSAEGAPPVDDTNTVDIIDVVAEPAKPPTEIPTSNNSNGCEASEPQVEKVKVPKRVSAKAPLLSPEIIRILYGESDA